jgi:hypothetical protein
MWKSNYVEVIPNNSFKSSIYLPKCINMHAKILSTMIWALRNNLKGTSKIPSVLCLNKLGIIINLIKITI